MAKGFTTTNGRDSRCVSPKWRAEASSLSWFPFPYAGAQERPARSQKPARHQPPAGSRQLQFNATGNLQFAVSRPGMS
jgi:hypothetical protein